MICGLTNAAPAFEDECPDITVDLKASIADFATDEEKKQEAIKAKAEKDILYGSLWCFGGVIGTMADIGFIFWGAIVFGGIQLVQGLTAMPQKKSE